MNLRFTLSSILIGSFIFLLSACGFHLRGSNEIVSDIPISVSWNGRAVSPFVSHHLKNRLERQGDPEHAELQIVLNKATFKKRVLVLDKEALPAEQALILELNYITRSINNSAPTVQNLRLEKNYYFDATELISSDQYEIDIKKQILDQAAQIIHRRIESSM